MLVRDAIQARIAKPAPIDDRVGQVSLPRSLRGERLSARTAILQRISSSRLFALGSRSGALRAAQARSGRPLRLDVRQRVIVKALVSRHLGKNAARGAALARHVVYLGRSGAGAEGARATFFDRDREDLDAHALARSWREDRHHFRLIISPEHGDRLANLKAYVRAVMARVSTDLGEHELTWVATCHFDTDQPHAHVLVRGRRGDGRDLVIPRAYIAYGVRARAQEIAQERLGDLSRAEAERRIWRETEADRFTGFDRRLLLAADAERRVADGVGRGDAWSALTRGRLRHLERLGLAIRIGDRYRLDLELETKLRALQRRNDVIRTLNQRRLEGARDVRELGAEPVRGEVVRSGFHDELGGAPFVVVRDRAGVEHYAKLALGTPAPEVGQMVDLAPARNAARVLDSGRGFQDLGL
jgi:type IV secretory pathway VirD2 relaxase